MDNPVLFGMWLGALLYAAIGLLGVIALHDGVPSVHDLTAGYGVAYSTVASSETGNLQAAR
jgi:threonine/homoserine/homoserine lactone efflux protein